MPPANPTMANLEVIQATLSSGIALGETADANWATLTPAQKDQAARLSIRYTVKLARLVLRELDAS